MSGQPGKALQPILCDMCPENDRKPAQKTCMKCEISMCVEHLKPHLTTPVLLQTHPLTEPVALGATTKCPQHGKLLEYYCLDDLTCVCVSCAIEDQHRLHNMKTFSTAHKELKEKLIAKQRELQTVTGQDKGGLEEWERVETEKVQRSSIQLIEAVNSLHDRTLTSIHSSVSTRMVSIRTSKNSLQAAEREKDTFRFLQMYSQVHQDVEKAKAVDMGQGLEPGVERQTLVQDLSQKGTKMVAQVDDFWKSLVALADPKNQEGIFDKDLKLTFEAKISDHCMTLSKDKRKIFYTEFQAVQRPSSVFHIQNAEAPSSELRRWVLSLSSDYNWTIGLCQKNYLGSGNNSIFGLCYTYKKLSSLPRGEYHEVSGHVTNLQTYEVIWHPDSLSFFSWAGPHQKREVVTIELDPYHKALTPFVCFQLNAPQVIMGSSFGSSHRPRQQTKCSCGQVHYLDENHYQHNYSRSCSCGKPISVSNITELVCELLGGCSPPHIPQSCPQISRMGRDILSLPTRKRLL